MIHGPEGRMGKAADAAIELERPDRLETEYVFVRHGEAEKLEGAHDHVEIDAKREHTEKGEKQVYDAGRKFAETLGTSRDDLFVFRSSGKTRADQTTEGFIDGLLRREGELLYELPTIQRYPAPVPPRPWDGLAFHPGTGPFYAGGQKRLGDERMKITDQWVRTPKWLQTDIDNAGVDLNSGELLAGMETNFQKTVATVDRASRVLLKRWERYQREHPEEARDHKQPRLFVVAGSHGFVSEPWLLKAIEQHEKETGEQIPLNLGYGEYYTIRFPSKGNDPVTLEIKGEKIEIDEKFLELPEKK